MRTHRRRRRDNAKAEQHSLDKARLPVMAEVTSSTKRCLQNSNDGQTSEALQLTNICSLSQASDYYNSSIALLLDWGKASLNDPVPDQTSVISKDYKVICQVESEDKSATSLGSKVNDSEEATKSQPLSSEVGGNQKHGDSFAIDTEKEVPGSATEDVFCCILGWLARSTGKSMCSCKKDRYAVSDFGLDNSYSKQPAVATLTLDHGSRSLSSTLEEPKGQTNQANLSAEGRKDQRNESNLSADGAEDVPTLVTEGLFGCKEKRNASTSLLRSGPLLFTSGDVMVQKPGDQNENLPHKHALNIKKKSALEMCAPTKELISSRDNKMESKCGEGRSPSHKDPLSINRLAPGGSVHTSEVETVNLPCVDVLNIKKESDLEENEIGKELCSPHGNKMESKCDKDKSLVDKDPTILNRPPPPNGLVHVSERGNVKLPFIDVLNIKKENDLEESAAGKEHGSLYGDKKHSECLGKSLLNKDTTVMKQSDPSIGSLNTSEAKKINLPCEDTLKVKESVVDEGVTSKESSKIFCCIVSWLAQDTGKKVQCSCAGEGKTEPSLPTSESDCILKIKDGSSVPDTKRTLLKRNCSIEKEDLQASSEETQTGIYINEVQLQRGQKVKLSDGDLLRIQARPTPTSSPSHSSDTYFLFQRVKAPPLDLPTITAPQGPTPFLGFTPVLSTKSLGGDHVGSPHYTTGATVILNSIGSISKMKRERMHISSLIGGTVELAKPPTPDLPLPSRTGLERRSSRRKTQHKVLRDLEEDEDDEDDEQVAEGKRERKRGRWKEDDEKQSQQKTELGRKPRGRRRRNTASLSETESSAEPCAWHSCRLPQEDTVSWVQCDRCDSWYHVICIGRSLTSLQNTDFHCGCT